MWIMIWIRGSTSRTARDASRSSAVKPSKAPGPEPIRPSGQSMPLVTSFPICTMSGPAPAARMSDTTFLVNW